MSQEKEGFFSSIGASLHALNVFLFEKNKKASYIAAIILIPLLTYFVFSMEASDKRDQMLGVEDIKDIVMSPFGSGSSFLETGDMEEMQGIINKGDYLGQGASSDLEVVNSQDKVIKGMEITLIWEDETEPPGRPRLRQYENLPDTFSLSMRTPNGTSIDLGTSDTGRISDKIEFTEAEMESFYGEGNFTITISLISAGNWEPSLGPGIVQLTDDGNEWSITIKEDYYGPASE